MKFTKDDLDLWEGHANSFLVDILNGEYDLAQAREDLQSLICSEYDPRNPHPNNVQKEAND